MAVHIDSSTTQTKTTGKLEDFLTELRSRSGIVSDAKHGQDKDGDVDPRKVEAARKADAAKASKDQRDKVDTMLKTIKDSAYKQPLDKFSFSSEKEEKLFKDKLVNKLNEPKDYGIMISIGAVDNDFMYVAQQNTSENPFILSRLSSAISTSEKMDFDKYTIESGAGNLVNKFASEGIKMEAELKSVKAKDEKESQGVITILYIFPVDPLNTEQINKVISILNQSGLTSDVLTLRRQSEMNDLETSLAIAPADNTPDAVLTSIVGAKNNTLIAPPIIVDDIKHRENVLKGITEMIEKNFKMKLEDNEMVFYDGLTEVGRFPVYSADMLAELKRSMETKDEGKKGDKEDKDEKESNKTKGKGRGKNKKQNDEQPEDVVEKVDKKEKEDIIETTKESTDKKSVSNKKKK